MKIEYHRRQLEEYIGYLERVEKVNQERGGYIKYLPIIRNNLYMR